MNIRHRLERLSLDRRLQRTHDGETDPDAIPIRLPPQLKVAADVLSLLQDQVQAVYEDDRSEPLERACVVCYLAGVALKAIETGNLAARIEMLEAVLKQRRGDAKQ